MAKTSSLRLTLFCLLLCFSAVNADDPPSQITGPPYLNSTSSDPTDPHNCSTKHSGDYYGIGVRLGIYMVWLQSYLANTFVPEEISGALDANTIFLLALLAAIFRGTLIRGLPGEHMVKIDGLILMQLSAGYMFGCLSMWGYRTAHYQNEGRAGIRHFGRIGTHARLTLACAISAYGVWFWTIGVLPTRGLATLTNIHGGTRKECYPLNTFFFAKLDVLGGIRYFYITITIGCTLYYGLMLIVAAVERSRHGLRIIQTRGGIPPVTYETGLKVEELNLLYKLLRIGNLVWMILTAIMVELTLIWNKVTDVVGPGGQVAFPSQLLPMLIGALTLLRMLWLIFKQKSEAWRSCRREKLHPSSEQAQQGLGITAHQDESDHDGGPRRPAYRRYLVAWLPWLSQFSLWTRQAPDAQQRSDGPGTRDSVVPMLEKTPQSAAFPSTPYRDSYGASNGASPARSPMITF